MLDSISLPLWGPTREYSMCWTWGNSSGFGQYQASSAALAVITCHTKIAQVPWIVGQRVMVSAIALLVKFISRISREVLISCHDISISGVNFESRAPKAVNTCHAQHTTRLARRKIIVMLDNSHISTNTQWIFTEQRPKLYLEASFIASYVWQRKCREQSKILTQ